MSAKSTAKTAAGAIVMALGIFSQGVLAHFTGQHSTLGTAWAWMLAAVWVYLFYCYLNSVRKGSFYTQHLQSPIGRLAIGTWVAGTSTFVVVLAKASGGYHMIYWLPVLFNAGLWIFFLYSSCLSLKEVVMKRLYPKIHGVILLTTVATQSLVLMLSAVFGQHELVNMLNKCLVIFGVFLYVAAASLVIYRYIRQRWSLADDWNNTNCMLHGAVSITGAASLQSHTFTSSFIAAIWVFAFTMLLLVEAVEIARAFARIRRYGWKTGLLNYDVTQWTRLFTFGMFYFFTMKSATIVQNTDSWNLTRIQHGVLDQGAWLICLLYVAEIILLIFFQYAGANKTQTA